MKLIEVMKNKLFTVDVRDHLNLNVLLSQTNELCNIFGSDRKHKVLSKYAKSGDRSNYDSYIDYKIISTK